MLSPGACVLVITVDFNVLGIKFKLKVAVVLDTFPSCDV